jgi:histone deacetylase 11
MGELGLSQEDIVKRDEIVFESAQKRGIPVVSLTSGGYTPTGSPEAIAASIGNLVKKGYLKPVRKVKLDL